MPHQIALIGGTGPEGRGLALRFAAAGHSVILGSRDTGRAVDAARALVAEHAAAGALDVRGATNAEAAAAAELAVVTVPFEAHRATLKGLTTALGGKIVVDAVVPVRFERGPRPVEVPEGSATEQAAAILGGSRVVGAFHTVAASSLLDLGVQLDEDTLVTGDDAEAKATVLALVAGIPGLRGVDAGPLRYSRFAEGMTVLLIGINGRYRTHAGLRIAGLPG